LIKITGIEANKAIEGDNRDKLIEIQQNSWVEKLWTDNQDNLKINLTDAQKQYAIQKAFERL
jgi:hypothetical protein